MNTDLIITIRREQEVIPHIEGPKVPSAPFCLPPEPRLGSLREAKIAGILNEAWFERHKPVIISRDGK